MTGNDRSLMHDLMFKEVFADHHNRKQLIRLLEIVLDCKLDNVKDELKVTYESPLTKKKNDQKSVRGDVIIEYGDTTINLECYTNFDQNSVNKSGYYMMRIHANKLEVGDGYHKLGKTVQVNFVENCSLDLEDVIVSDFHIACDWKPSVKWFPEDFCVKVVQIDKARELGYTDDETERWLKFIAARNYEERKTIAKGDELLVELNEWVNKYVRGDKAEELNKWDLEIATNKGVVEGHEKGLVEGHKKGLAEGRAQRNVEIAKEMLKLNMSIEDISKVTNLDIKTIEELKNQ